MIAELVFGFMIIGLSIACVFFAVQSNKAYWKGRGEGWWACQELVLKRAKEKGIYETAKELLQ